MSVSVCVRECGATLFLCQVHMRVKEKSLRVRVCVDGCGPALHRPGPHSRFYVKRLVYYGVLLRCIMLYYVNIM